MKPAIPNYEQLRLGYSDTALWQWMEPSPRPCFTPTLLRYIRETRQWLEGHKGWLDNDEQERVDFLVLASREPGVFSLGGDVNEFIRMIRTQDKVGLRYYARDCADGVYSYLNGLHCGITTVAVVQGRAFGGGFEAALACDYIIAEQGATFCLPEVKFGMFPGMGALSILSRKVGMKTAMKVASSGWTYSADTAHIMGIVDEVAADGHGCTEALRFIEDCKRQANHYKAIEAARRRINPVPLSELYDIADIWVDAALSLTEGDLQMMERIVAAQDRAFGGKA